MLLICMKSLLHQQKMKRYVKILLDVAREEKTHFDEFQRMLQREDKEQIEELEHGKEEVEEELGI